MKFKEFIELHRGYDLPEQKRIKGDYMVFASTSVGGSHNEYKVKAPGVVTGRSGSLGEVQFAKQNFWPLNTTLFVSDFKNNLPRYVYYFLKTLNLGRFNTGAGVPTLNRNDLDNLDIHVHLLPEQQKISSILSAYDNLIEINEQRIKILEEMARLIYKEWFVKFRFPGYKKVKMVESELGKIPEGWEVRSTLDIEGVNLIKAKVKRYNGVKEYFATANVEGNNIIKDGEIVTYDERPSRAQMQPEENTIWFAKMRETFKVLCFTSANKGKAENSILSTGFAGFKLVKDKFGFFYFTVSSERFHMLKDQYCTGATQMSLTIEGLNLIKIVLPKKDLVRDYSELIQPIIDQIIRFQQQSSILSQTRDMLLPKLFSGEINVSDLYINTKE